MNKKYLSVFCLRQIPQSGTILLASAIIISGIIISGAIAGSALAQITANQNTITPFASITYPIAELGSCQSKDDCKIFCDDAVNTNACLAFAETRNLMSPEELAAAKRFKDVGMTGPGGCKGKDACGEYCSIKDNMEVCIAFAEKNGLTSEQKLQESKKVLAAIKKNTKPLGCNGRQECDKYCASAEYMEECINFGAEAGILPASQQENARKVLTAIKNGAVPPCQGRACPGFCSNRPETAAACEKFRIEAGIPTRTQMTMIQRILTLITEKGITMPTCSGTQGCQDYCSQDTNIEECIKFAEDEGVITPSQAKAVRAGEEAAPEGPGGCKSKEECDVFCNDPNNSEVCFNFAKDNGMISDEDFKKIENSQQKMKESFNNMPAEVSDCLTASLGVETIEKLKSGNAMPGKKMAEQMKVCFESFTPTPPSGLEGQPTQPPQPGQQPTKPGQPGGAGGPNQGQGFNPGSGQGGGQGQNTNPNPVKCIEDCELVGKNCMGQASEKSNVCLSKGTYCRTVTCETFGAGGTRPTTQEEWNRCASYCRTIEDNCYAGISPTDSDCRTTKDVCVMNCQKASKPAKPTQPSQPTQPGKPNKPPEPTRPADSTQSTKPTESTEPTPPSPPTSPQQPTPPTQPTQPTGKCGDGVCGRMEQADPSLCPQDCGKSTQPTQPY